MPTAITFARWLDSSPEIEIFPAAKVFAKFPLALAKVFARLESEEFRYGGCRAGFKC